MVTHKHFVLRLSGAPPKAEPIRFTISSNGTVTFSGQPEEPVQILRHDPNGFMMILYRQRVISGVVTRIGDHGENLNVSAEGISQSLKITDASLDALESGLAAASPDNDMIQLSTPIPGLVKSIQFELNAQVEAGQTIAILEAMKMENDIVAPHNGILIAIAVKPGQAVPAGTNLATLKIT